MDQNTIFCPVNILVIIYQLKINLLKKYIEKTEMQSNKKTKGEEIEQLLSFKQTNNISNIILKGEEYTFLIDNLKK